MGFLRVIKKFLFMSLFLPLLVSPVSAEELFDTKASEEHFKAGLKLYDQQDFTGAIKEFDAAIQINPENADAYYFIGYSYYKMDQMDKAMAVFDQAYAIDSKYSPLPRRPQIPPP